MSLLWARPAIDADTSYFLELGANNMLDSYHYLHGFMPDGIIEYGGASALFAGIEQRQVVTMMIYEDSSCAQFIIVMHVDY